MHIHCGGYISRNHVLILLRETARCELVERMFDSITANIFNGSFVSKLGRSSVYIMIRARPPRAFRFNCEIAQRLLPFDRLICLLSQLRLRAQNHALSFLYCYYVMPGTYLATLNIPQICSIYIIRNVMTDTTTK